MAEKSTKKAGDKAETSSKASQKKPEKKKKEGFIARISRFAKELRSEIKKIVWPTRKQVFNNTCVVAAVMVSVGAFIWIIDWVFAFLRGLVLGF